MPAKVVRKFRKLLSVLAKRDYRTALLRGGVAAAVEHGQLLKALKFKTVVDIGANRGQFALVARHCFPDARIIAFEPLSGPANRFRTVLGHDARIILHQVAIGPSAGNATMHVAAADDSSSLLPISPMQQSLFSGTSEVARETIKVEPLASRIKREELETPALLKIDVQGYELPGLQGCEALLDWFSHAYVECSFVELYEGQALAAEVINFLYERGFSLCGIYNVHYGPQGQAIQADMLFARTIK
jgi:FkbM family methyltransferase